ncbi:chemotaxis protein CheX [Solidesulfovibrio magneticus]|uniref:Chemotaxis protein CheX n=1 Tax=Solidesulfovibrio magneticus (strain ATCC 700980 / DSM 13731 / RS-1) TaxID=573370 RepID=C4XKZ1_SOLM1|nr:chemotaxis protein CheX [Solidesulfovibrio magneticus]BAH74530.1 chemotaxis protein CheX [Solidesulfovibrio magneticus RS-1]
MDTYDLNIAMPFIQATKHVLSTMAQISPTPGTPFIKKGTAATGDISAVVGLTGTKNGSIALSFSKKCAINILKNMIGDDIEDVVKDAMDTVGELTNMISGQARAQLSQIGLNLTASTPTIIVGDHHRIEHMTTCTIIAIPFSTSHGNFSVEFSFEGCHSSKV